MALVIVVVVAVVAAAAIDVTLSYTPWLRDGGCYMGRDEAWSAPCRQQAATGAVSLDYVRC